MRERKRIYELVCIIKLFFLFLYFFFFLYHERRKCFSNVWKLYHFSYGIRQNAGTKRRSSAYTYVRVPFVSLESKREIVFECDCNKIRICINANLSPRARCLIFQSGCVVVHLVFITSSLTAHDYVIHDTTLGLIVEHIECLESLLTSAFNIQTRSGEISLF